ncbi:MAG: response regulator transcription factor [Acidobacteria bacterium]|nr:response regulator transcription factor [Acidobacteriota bacterium]
MKKVRILVADDHEVVRHGIRVLLEAEPGWDVCATAVTGREAVRKAEELKPDVVVMDISMPELNGLEATRQIVKLVPRTEVLILTMHDSEDLVREVLDAGARGYVLKSDAGRNLVAAVNALCQHKPFFTSKVSELVLQGYLKRGSRPAAKELPRSRLTPREREIVQLLSEGKSNKEIAVALGISVKTAETHRANIMNKLGLHSVTDLVRYAVRNKMVEP